MNYQNEQAAMKAAELKAVNEWMRYAFVFRVGEQWRVHYAGETRYQELYITSRNPGAVVTQIGKNLGRAVEWQAQVGKSLAAIMQSAMDDAGLPPEYDAMIEALVKAAQESDDE